VLEYDGASGAIQRWYAYGLGSNEVLNQTNVVAGTRAALIPDIQGSVIASLDSSSGTLSKIGYLPYGKSAGGAAPFGYTGQRIDPETNGLYYYRARHYSPPLGRFFQTDPIGFSGGSNTYAYVNNDPLNRLDPFGLCDNPGCGGGSIAAPGALALPGAGDIAVGIGGRVAAGAFALPLAIAGGILAVTSTATADRSQDEVQNVVRAGVATPNSLITQSLEHSAVPGLYGFSVQSAPGLSVDDLARAGAFPNRQISVTTTAELAGVGVAVVPSPGAGYHATAQVPNPLPPDLASSISGVFRQQDNPFRVPR
jgi:RHS repeat-associated protein